MTVHRCMPLRVDRLLCGSSKPLIPCSSVERLCTSSRAGCTRDPRSGWQQPCSDGVILSGRRTYAGEHPHVCTLVCACFRQRRTDCIRFRPACSLIAAEHAACARIQLHKGTVHSSCAASLSACPMHVSAFRLQSHPSCLQVSCINDEPHVLRLCLGRVRM